MKRLLLSAAAATLGATGFAASAHADTHAKAIETTAAANDHAAAHIKGGLKAPPESEMKAYERAKAKAESARARPDAEIDAAVMVDERIDHDHGLQARIGDTWHWVADGQRLTADGRVVAQGGMTM